MKKKVKSKKRKKRDIKPEKNGIKGDNPKKKFISVKEQDNKIRKVFKLQEDEDLPMVSDETLEIYYQYLMKELTFPFDAEYSEEVGFIKDELYSVSIKKFVHYGITGDNDFYGLFCEARYERKKMILILADVEVKEVGSNK